jgi:hypothetical protein
MGFVEVVVLLLLIAIPLGAVLLVVRAISRRPDR